MMWTDIRLEQHAAAVQLFCRAGGQPKPKVTWYLMERAHLDGDDYDDAEESAEEGIPHEITADNGAFEASSEQSF